MPAHKPDKENKMRRFNTLDVRPADPVEFPEGFTGECKGMSLQWIENNIDTSEEEFDALADLKVGESMVLDAGEYGTTTITRVE